MSHRTLLPAIHQGARWQVQVAYTDANGAAIPLAPTWTAARMQLRLWPGSPDVVLNLTTESGGGLVMEPVPGEVHVDVGATKTATLPAGSFVADLEIFNPATPDNVLRLLSADIPVDPETTR